MTENQYTSENTLYVGIKNQTFYGCFIENNEIQSVKSKSFIDFINALQDLFVDRFIGLFTISNGQYFSSNKGKIIDAPRQITEPGITSIQGKLNIDQAMAAASG